MSDLRTASAVPLVEEMRLLLETTADEQDSLLFRVLYASGIRVGELLALQPPDVLGDILVVRSGKGDKDRYVLLDPETARRLQAWMAGMAPTERLFKIPDGSVWNHVVKWTTACGLYQKYTAQGLRFSPHTFRHAFATHVYEGGMAVDSIRWLLGHVSAVTTDIYIGQRVEVWKARYQEAMDSRRGPGSAASRGVPCEEQPGRTMDQDYLEQLRQEIPTGPVTFNQLPLVPPSTDLLAVVRAASGEASLAGLVLYRSGVFLEELALLEPGGIDFATGIIQCGPRQVVVDPETLQALAGRAPVFTWSVKELRAELSAAAERTGLAGRFRGVERVFTPATLRHGFATHLLEGGLDLFSVHTLLGNRFMDTTLHYLRTAASCRLPEYRASHPLCS